MVKNMKRQILIIGAMSGLLLSGCSAEEYLLSDNEFYREYENIKRDNSNAIDSDGYYVFNQIDEQEEYDNTVPEGSVHISFATNSLMSVWYYYDEQCTDEVDKQNCYLNPGDSIYAKIEETSQATTNYYEFTGFQIAGFEEDHSNYNYSETNDNKITIPIDCKYKELSVIPKGNYKSRKISFLPKCKDSDENAFATVLVWNIITDSQTYYTKSESYDINAFSSFQIKTLFDPEKYYFIEEETEPKCESFDNEKGEIVFRKYDSHDSVDSYKPVFEKKKSISISSIESDEPVTIWIDDKKYDYDPDSSEFTMAVRNGAEVRIEPADKIKSVGFKKNLRALDGKYVYMVCDETENILFDPLEYTFNGGTVSFFDSKHNPITEKTELKFGEVIYYSGKAEEDYVFSMGDQELTLMVDEKIAELKNTLSFIPKHITLPQPEKGGEITYFVNGEEVKEKTVDYSAENVITANFKSAPSYKTNYLSDGAECTWSTSDQKLFFIDNSGRQLDVNDVFVHSEAQKPNLSISKDKSVDSETQISVYNGDKALIVDQKNKTLIKNEEIVSDLGLKIAISGWSALEKEALRINVTFENNLAEKTNEVYYIFEGSGVQEINTKSDGKSYYETIKIEISKVKGDYFNLNDYSVENGKITFKYKDTDKMVEDKDYIDFSRDITVLLKPDEGYKLSKKGIGLGVNIKNNQHQFTCKFSKLSDEFKKMLDKISIE